jgi:RNA polymerase sigma-70 factor (ECF subfamily)
MSVELDFNEVYEEFQPKILHYVARMTGIDEAEDITQEIFQKISFALKDFEGKSKLSTWIYRIATNTALDRLRSASFKNSSEQDTFEDSVEDRNVWAGRSKTPLDQKLIRKEMSECVWEYIEKLPSDYRTVIVLSQFEGFKNREIADILQISLDAVKIRLHRARASLKNLLDDACLFEHNEQGILICDRRPTLIQIKDSD